MNRRRFFEQVGVAAAVLVGLNIKPKPTPKRGLIADYSETPTAKLNEKMLQRTIDQILKSKPKANYLVVDPKVYEDLKTHFPQWS